MLQDMNDAMRFCHRYPAFCGVNSDDLQLALLLIDIALGIGYESLTPSKALIRDRWWGGWIGDDRRRVLRRLLSAGKGDLAAKPVVRLQDVLDAIAGWRRVLDLGARPWHEIEWRNVIGALGITEPEEQGRGVRGTDRYLPNMLGGFRIELCRSSSAAFRAMPEYPAACWFAIASREYLSVSEYRKCFHANLEMEEAVWECILEAVHQKCGRFPRGLIRPYDEVDNIDAAANTVLMLLEKRTRYTLRDGELSLAPEHEIFDPSIYHGVAIQELVYLIHDGLIWNKS